MHLKLILVNGTVAQSDVMTAADFRADGDSLRDTVNVFQAGFENLSSLTGITLFQKGRKVFYNPANIISAEVVFDESEFDD